MTENLTVKQQAFVNAFLISGNASFAYRSAYNAENMKAATVHSRAHELLKHSKIRVRLQQLRDQTRHNNQITVDEIARGLRRAIAGAEEPGQWSAAVSASVSLAKLGSLMSEKRAIQINDNEHLAAVIALSKL